MDKSSSASTLKDLNLDSEWLLQPLLDWVSAYKQIFLWGFIVFVSFIILASKFFASRSTQAEGDFFQAQASLIQIQQISESSTETSLSADVKELETIMQRHPEIKPRYEGFVAQTLLLTDQTANAKILAQDIFTRVKTDDLQLYQDYSQTSLLIEEGLYSKALEKAQTLQTTLDSSLTQTNPLLTQYNLLRLALLNQQLNQPLEELNAWEQFQKQSKRLDNAKDSNQVFNVGQASLDQYIEERRKFLVP